MIKERDRELLAVAFEEAGYSGTARDIRAVTNAPTGTKVALLALAQARIEARKEALEEAAKVARDAATEAADIALEGGERARANESMEAMATRIAQRIERL